MNNRDLIKNMTLEEKASLMSGKDFWTTKDLEKHGIPSMFLADGPNGIRKQATASDHLGLNESLPATCFPTAATVGNSWDKTLCEEIGTYIGKEAVSQKVNVLLGPGTNIKRNPLCGRNFEYFSEDPYLSGSITSAYVRGIQSNGVSACVKHYAANNQEHRRMVIDTIVDKRTLREIYLMPFEMAVKNGKTKTLMTSYNMVNGVHANENMFLMQDVLRKEWNYQGVVVTDWGGSNDRVKGLIAGNELEMPSTNGETNRDIVNAVKNGTLDQSILDDAVDRLLTLVFDTNKVFEQEPQEFDKDKHHQMAMKAAESSIVMLKNENSILPLSNQDKVAIIGDFAKNPRYQGAGSSIVNPTFLDDTISNVNEYDLNYIGYEQGFKRLSKKPNNKLEKKAINLANNADVIIYYMGLDEFTEVEGLDRNNMKIPVNQLQLLNKLHQTNKKIVVVLSCGSVVEMDWVDQAHGVLHAYLSGQAGAKAILNVLTGKVNPSGKLAESYPVKYDDVPSSSNFPGNEVSVEYREGLYIGYRYYDTANVPVKFPFGYGLSYTTFDYSNISISNEEVSFDLKNTGSIDGAEIVQLYVGMENSKIFRANKELKGFTKVFLKAGEKQRVSIPFDEYTFRYFNVDTDQWGIESGKYTIYIGASSIDVKLSDTLDVKGTSKTTVYEKEQLSPYFKGSTKNVTKETFEKLLGKEVPNPNYSFYKKNRMVIDYNTTVQQLRYSKRWVGRLFSKGVLFANKFLHFIGKHETANVIMMGLYHQPMRGLSRMSGGIISWGQLDAMITMFNGHFFKGVRQYFKEGRIKRKRKKTL